MASKLARAAINTMCLMLANARYLISLLDYLFLQSWGRIVLSCSVHTLHLLRMLHGKVRYLSGLHGVNSWCMSDPVDDLRPTLAFC